MFITSSSASEASFTRTESENESFHWRETADKIIHFQYKTEDLNITHKQSNVAYK